jgi:hypothetical protein
MEAKKIIYLLALAIAVLAIFFGFSCNREESDTIPPSVPFGLNATAATTSITLSWSASSDNVGVSGYKVFRDGVEAGNATSTSFTDKNLVPNSSYVYTVSAFDANGNVSELSAPYTAKTVDDCPTCSKWMTEINFIQPSVGIINADESKSAGSLMVKNISTSTHTANLTLTFSGAGASAVDSLNYTIGGQTAKRKVENNSVTLNQVSVPANSSTEIKLVYRIKEVIPAGIVDQSQITFALTATTTDESGVTQPGNRIFPNVALDKLKVYTAKIDATKSYEASAVAEDKILFGNSVAKAFVLEVTTPGTVRLEAIGKLSDGTSAIKYLWVNGADHSDFNVSVSTLSPIVPKTTFGNNSFVEVNLKAGTNVIAFKTNPYSGKIANNAEVGLKVTGSGFSMTNESYTANSVAANLAGKIKVLARILVGLYIPPQMAAYDFHWCEYFIYPQNEDGSYNVDGYPKIAGLSLSTEYYAKNYPKVFFVPSSETPPEFTENFEILGVQFGKNIDPDQFGTVFAKDLANNTVKYENNMISFSGPAVQTFTAGGNPYLIIAIMLNAYNADTDYFRPGYVTFDPARTGWKFVGNPELELWTEGEVKTSKRIN